MLYKNIAVAVDGSRTSLLALSHAAELAQKANAQLTLVTIASPVEFMSIAPEFLQNQSHEVAAMEQSREILSYAEKVAVEAGVKKVDTHMAVSTGAGNSREMAKELVDFCEERNVDLIVLGTHGRTGLMHMLMGSFAETLMRVSTLPLLIIRRPQES